MFLSTPPRASRARQARACVVAGMLIASAWPAARADDTDRQAGLLAYEQGRYVLAEQHLRAAAARGDAQAAEIAGFMWAYGPALYPGIVRNDREALRLFDIAARDGRAASRAMACALARRLRMRPAEVPACTAPLAESLALGGRPSD